MYILVPQTTHNKSDWVFSTGNGNFSIAGIFDIFSVRTSEDGYLTKTINPQIGFHFQEAYRFAIKEINKNKSLLYGFQLTEETATTDNWGELMNSKILLRYYIDRQAQAAIGPFESYDAFKISLATNSYKIPLVSYAGCFDTANDDTYHFRNVPADLFKVIC